MKLKMKICVLVAMFFIICQVSYASESKLKPDSSIKVYLEDQIVNFMIDPIKIEGTTFVQFTPLFDILELQYIWDPITSSINGHNEKIKFSLQISHNDIIVNDRTFTLLHAPFIFEGRTFVPLRLISEVTGYQVDWHQEERSIRLRNKNHKDKLERTPISKEEVDVSKFMFGYKEKVNTSDFWKLLDRDYQQYVNIISSELGEFRTHVIYPIDLLGPNTWQTYDFEWVSDSDSVAETDKRVNFAISKFIYNANPTKENYSNRFKDYDEIVKTLTTLYGEPHYNEVITFDTNRIILDYSEEEVKKGIADTKLKLVKFWKFKNVTISIEAFEERSSFEVVTTFSYN